MNNTSGAVTGAHTYSSPGIYVVRLRVENGLGASAIDVYGAEVSDERFGLIAGANVAGGHLGSLGVANFIDYTSNTANRPPGTTKIPYVEITPTITRMSPAEIASVAAESPGATWYLGGEPNVPAQGNISAQQYVVEFDYYATHIKAADPTARLMSASILNWDTPCFGCGLTKANSGETWLTAFVNEYRATHGGHNPPVDVWAIDVFPLNWDAVPMTDWLFAADQVRGLRQYLNSAPLFAFSAPIWITETGSHWAYSGWVATGNGGADLPPGLDWDDDYLWDTMESNFLVPWLNWLRANAQANRVEKWFFFRTYVNVQAQALSDAYGGIYFVDSPVANAALNQLGVAFRDYALGQR